MKSFLSFISSIAFVCLVSMEMSGCANIISPAGGPRDSIPPRLVLSVPRDSATRVNSNRIALTFNEYVEVRDIQTNLVVSPVPKKQPQVDYKLRNVTIKLMDSLEANTTYSINFGDAIKDVNEGNIAKGFTFVFSTGSYIDSNTLSGKVVVAETGKIDTTLVVVLHKNMSDSAVIKNTPRYYTKLDGKGNFTFKNLPPGTFAAYVVPNNYSKKYEDSTALFAFLDSPVIVSGTSPRLNFYAFEEEKRKAPGSNQNTVKTGKEDKRLRYSISLENGQQDILNKTLLLDFNRKLTRLDTSKIVLYDTNFNAVNNYKIYLDSGGTKVKLLYDWKENMQFRLIISKDAMTDSAGTTLTKTDTLKFSTKRESDYGSIRWRFTNLDLSRNPVLQLFSADKLVESIPLVSKEYFRKLFKPGDYEMRILFDDNKNGVWDSGNFKKRRQPETVQLIPQKLNIRPNWENEADVKL